MYKRCTKPEIFLKIIRSILGSLEGPGWVLDPMRITSSAPRVHWYGLWSLECKSIVHMANFLLGAIWPPPGLIKDSQTSAW